MDDLESKVSALERELDDLAQGAASAKDKRVYEQRAFELINSYHAPHGARGGATRQGLIRYYYKAVENYTEENHNG